VEAHCHCGAVAAHVDWEKDQRRDPGIPTLKRLLEDLHGNSPIENLMLQGGLAAKLTTNHYLVLMYLDWEKKVVDLLSNAGHPIAQHLKSAIESKLKLADADGQLQVRLATQRPHTVAVQYHKLPYSLNTIFGADLGEIFATTGSEGGLDEHDQASLYYSVEHCGSKHIALVAPSIEGIRTMFDKWETDIREMEIKGERQFARMLDSKELRITRYSYDLYSGIAYHLV